MKIHWLFFLLSSCLIVSCDWNSRAQISANWPFTHHYAARNLPGDAGWGFGTPGLSDLDRDGDLDFVVSTPADRIFWFEYVEAGSWRRHVLGQISDIQLGSTILDVDRDGWPDLVIGGSWYKNPQDPRSEEFQRLAYDVRIKTEIHDIIHADIDLDREPEVIVLGDKEGCFWYDIPIDPVIHASWTRHTITLDVLDTNDAIHGGISPAGAGDLDGDRDCDIIMPGRWYENREKGTTWVKHVLPFGTSGPWGLSARSWVVDLDADGDQDIVMSDSDQKQSRVAWLENDGRNPPVFSRHFLPQRASGTRGSFHSLAVADFDNDGDLDILVAEQEDPSLLPVGAGPRWFLWNNEGNVSFTETIVLDARLGGHDLLIGDVDGDGDVDICSKIWNRWTDNANRGRVHIDYLENNILRKRVK